MRITKRQLRRIIKEEKVYQQSGHVAYSLRRWIQEINAMTGFVEMGTYKELDVEASGRIKDLLLNALEALEDAEVIYRDIYDINRSVGDLR